MTRTPASDGFGFYLQDLARVPALGARETRELAWRYINDGDEEARDALIRGHARLVVHLARRRARSGAALADLVADGNVGLILAVEKWDPARGTRFSTYAAWWINQAISRSPANSPRLASVPVYMTHLVGRWRRKGTELTERLGRPPRPDEIAGALDIPVRTLDSVRRAARTLEAIANESGGERELAAMRCPRFAPDESLEQLETRQLIHRALGSLDPHSMCVLALSFGLQGHTRHSLAETGRRLGITGERARVIQSRGVRAAPHPPIIHAARELLMNPEYSREKVAAAKLAIRAAEVVSEEVEVLSTTLWIEMIRCAHHSALRCLRRGCNAGTAFRAGIRAARCVTL